MQTSTPDTAETSSPGDMSCKAVVLGASGVGKTALLHRLVYGEFTPDRAPSCGGAMCRFRCQLPDGIGPLGGEGAAAASSSSPPHVVLNIWDTAGQERYASMAPMYYRGAAAAVLAFDVTCRPSLAQAVAWARELRRQLPATTATALVATRCDMREAREVSPEEGAQTAAALGALYAETSAKTGEGVRAAFEALAAEAARRGTLVAARGPFQRTVHLSQGGGGGGGAASASPSSSSSPPSGDGGGCCR